MDPKHNPSGVVIALFSLLPILAALQSASAHETDQYTLPPGREFADFGDYLTRRMHDALVRGVERQNIRIKGAVEIKAAAEVKDLQSADEIASSVNRQFPVALFFINDLDKMAESKEIRAGNPGRIVGYMSGDGLRKYVDVPLNPFNAWSCRTIKACGVYFGTDKLGHFTDMGMHYFRTYREAVRAGKSEEQAISEMLKLGTEDPITSERGMLGLVTAGGYSNADLVSNYMGYCFYRNLTEPVMLKGQQRPPLLVRDGDYWKVADHVKPDSDFFSWFISDHLNEALNPSFYRDDMRAKIRKSIVERRKNVLVRYADPNGNAWSQDRFAAVTQELTTYYGFDYGHEGGGKRITVAETCFAKPPDLNDPSSRNADGVTSIHYAAERNDVQALDRLVSQLGGDVNVRVRTDVNAPAVDGDTPLHVAARDGRLEAVQFLLSRGAKVNATNARGVTPLHMAVSHPKVAQALVDAGAELNVADNVGRTSLHWAARDTNASWAVQLLLSRRADPKIADRDGRTALHDAARAAHGKAIELLVRGGADVNAGDRFGITPLHLAAADGGPAATNLLIAAGAQVNRADDFGCTPLHVAARNGQVQAVALLMQRGADTSVTDAYGRTALAAARCQRMDSVAQVLHGRHTVDGGAAGTAAATIR